MSNTPHLIPVSVWAGWPAALTDHNIGFIFTAGRLYQPLSGQCDFTGHPLFSPPPPFLVLIGADVIPHIFLQIRGLKLRGRLASLCLAILCQPDRSLIPNIKVWLLAQALWDTVAPVRTRPLHQLLFEVTESWVWVPAAAGCRVVTNHKMIEKSSGRAS